MGAGKKKKSRWAGIWTALLGALCALVLSVVFYGTMVYQLADDMQTSVQRTQSVTAADGYPARTLSIEGMTLLEEKKENLCRAPALPRRNAGTFDSQGQCGPAT